MKNKIFVIAAHPDDEILGCGGTIARLVLEGSEAHVLILGEGITSRDKKRDVGSRRSDLNKLKAQMVSANRLIGVEDIVAENFPDNRFDTVPLLDIIKTIEKHKKRIEPNVVFTHYQSDLNIDHRITYEAVMTSFRPLADETVKEIYSFEVLSSTEWSSSAVFSPDTFFDISSTIKNKLSAMKKYRSELCEYPHPRSLEGIELSAKYWGMKAGLRYAEAFKSIRKVL